LAGEEAVNSDFEIAPGFKASDWKSLTLDEKKPDKGSWSAAINAFSCRLRDRFVVPADELERLGKSPSGGNQRFGFAILALDFIVLETIQGFREGLPDHKKVSKKLVTSFLKGWGLFVCDLPLKSDPDELACQVYVNCRCALHHQGATADKLKVKVSGKTFDWNGENLQAINRKKFHQGIKAELSRYVAELSSLNQPKLLTNFKNKMDYIAGIKPPAA
jgi:hypothetical protein